MQREVMSPRAPQRTRVAASVLLCAALLVTGLGGGWLACRLADADARAASAARSSYETEAIDLIRLADYCWYDPTRCGWSGRALAESVDYARRALRH